MAAREAITALLFTYAELIDSGDLAGIGELFADAEITFEGFDHVQRGREEIRAMYESTTRRYEKGTPRTKHVITNVIVEIDEPAGSARVRSYFTVFQAVPDALSLQPIIAGRYHDRFEGSNDAWRFRSRHMLVDLVGELGHHMLVDLPRLANG